MSGAAPTREIAYRVFADEFAESTYSYAESDEERAPQYLVTPTGARINRIFVVGVLTEIEEVSDGVLRARIVDPTGAFVLYAGQYQPEALSFFERAEPPMFVSLTGKARTFEPEDSEQVYTSLRPERVNEVDAETRDTWVVQTARHTLERAAVLAEALDLEARDEDLSVRLTAAGVPPGLAAGIPRAIREYEPTTGYLEAVQEMALDAVRVVAGELEAVSGGAGSPSEGGTGEVLTGFSDVSLAAQAAGTGGPGSPPAEDDGSTEAQSPMESEPTEAAGAATGPETPDAENESDGAAETGVDEGKTDRMDDAQAEREESPDAAENDGERDDAAETPPADPEEDELYELSEAERAEVEENYEVGFESGAEIGSPEETDDIEPEAGDPAPEETDGKAEDSPPETPPADASADTDVEAAESESGPEEERAGSQSESESGPVDDPAESDAGDAEPQDLVVETLTELGDGDGVPRSELVEALQDRHGLAESEIEDGIEAALLGGRCFESGSEDLKPI